MNKTLPGIFLCIIAVFGITACSLDVNSGSGPEASENKTAEKNSGDSAKVENEDKETPDEEGNGDEENRREIVSTERIPSSGRSAPDKSECLSARMSGARLIPSQTFVFDFEPFRGSCFVTFASVEEMVDATDVPRGSTFHIYRGGKHIFDFEDAFDGQFGCWVEGVGFEDLNDDGRTEVIVAGSCLGAKAGYPANAVYINRDDDFRTYPDVNESLNDFKTVKQIANYVGKNQGKFF